jgi:hypothetical protein
MRKFLVKVVIPISLYTVAFWLADIDPLKFIGVGLLVIVGSAIQDLEIE